MLPVDVGLIQKLSSSNTFLSSVWIFFWSTREQHQNCTTAQLRENIAHQTSNMDTKRSVILMQYSTFSDHRYRRALRLKPKCYSTTLNTFKATYILKFTTIQDVQVMWPVLVSNLHCQESQLWVPWRTGTSRQPSFHWSAQCWGRSPAQDQTAGQKWFHALYVETHWWPNPAWIKKGKMFGFKQLPFRFNGHNDSIMGT